MPGTQQEVMTAVKAAHDAFVDYFNANTGATLVHFDQQLLDAAAAGAASRQAEVDAGNAKVVQLTADKDTLQTRLDSANRAVANAKADAAALDAADVAGDTARAKLHTDLGG